MGQIPEAFTCKYKIDSVYKGLQNGSLLAVHRCTIY